MRSEDYSRCHAIHLRATMSSYGALHPWLEPILADPENALEVVEWTLVCELDARVIGYAGVTSSHLENLFVDPEAQGQGVGSRLLAAVEERIGLPMTLRCLTTNQAAQRFYLRHGFAVVQTESIDFHGRRLDAWLMRKPDAS